MDSFIGFCLDDILKTTEKYRVNGQIKVAFNVVQAAIDRLIDEKKDVPWRLYWELAQIAKEQGDINLVDEACNVVLAANPDFWFARELPKHVRGYYSQLGQDEIVERFFAGHPPKGRVFVEVGAFDGVNYSNVRRLRETHGWSGVSIEPVGKNFEKLSKFYAGQPVACVRCAIGEKEGVAELNVSSYPHLPDWGSDVATLSESETTRWQQLYGAVWHKEQIPVKTLTSVLQENHIATVDFLSVDAEGHDLDVLKGLDFSLYQPQIIVVEYNKHRQDIFDYLAARGYFLWLDNGQDLFMVAAQAIRMPAEQSVPDVINFNGSTGRQPYEEIQTAVEMGVHALINTAAEEIRCFVIVGGYLGWEIERILKTYPNVEIHVFEPSHRYFRPLSERYADNRRVFCHNLAVSDTNGTAVFHETSLEGTGSLLPMKQKEDRATWIAEGATAAENYQVKTVTLDDFAPLAGKKIDLLWCDVRGHELSVLKGASRVLRSCSAIFLEVAMYKTMYEGQCLFDELNKYLVSGNFYLRGIGLCNSGNGTGNALWVNTARHPSATRPAQLPETTMAFDAIRALLNPHLIDIDYLPKDKPITRKQLEPLALLTTSRFDIVAKFIYAEHREFGIDSPWGRELYEAHLRAFNDCHEGDSSSKSGIETFTGAFDTLLDSVKGNGFDPCHSLVPTGRNGVVIDEAHRVAACLLHRRPVEVLEFDIQAKTYNYGFFLDRGLDADYCDAIALEYCRLNPRTYIITVFPSAVGRELEIREILERNGEIFYARQVQLSRLGSVNLVRQMYDGEHWVGSFANRFEGAQNKAAECFRTDGPVRVYVFTSDDFEKVKAAKQQIRDLFGISNHSVHINDTHEETVMLGRLLLNANSVHFLNNAQLTTFPRFQAHLDNYKKVLREQGVDGECLCIDGSAVMAAYGIREAWDLDYLHFGYDNLAFDYPPEMIGSHNSEIAQHVTTRDDIIFNPRNHFYYNGVKFASLGITRALKVKWTKKRNIQKDFEDIALIDRCVAAPPALPHVHMATTPGYSALQTTGLGRQPKIVGLVPARNEKHTIAQCLRALSLFTDAIVYLDDASTDETPDIVASLVSQCRIERIIRKQEWHRDEPGDRNAMLRAGREIGGTHFIIIDADEMLTSNLLPSPGLRDAILQLQPGDRLALNWIQLWRSIDQYRFDQSVWTWNYKDIIFCDDGRCSYSSEFIHTPRVPGNLSGNRYTIQGYETGLLHFQFVNWRNLLVKQAWYRCLEHIREPEKPVTEINERYAPSKDESGLGLAPSPAGWFSGYPFFDRTVYDRPDEWREEQILGWFHQYGREHFAGLDIWDVEWTASSTVQVSSTQATAKQVLIFQESRLAHQLLDGLKGLEIGASAHNPFGLNTRNVGLYIDGYIQEQLGYCGRAVAIDIEAPAHAIPVPDESEDFIVSSHVVEHCPDLIRSFLEWFRIVRPGGYLFMIVPHRNASSADVGRPLTDWAHVCEDFRTDVSATTEADPKVYANQHCHVFAPETLKGFIAATFGDRLELVAEQQIDDKVGNGFTLAYCKARPLAAAYPWPVQAADGGILEMPHLASHGMNPYRVTAVVSTYRSEAFMRGCLVDLVNQTLHQRGKLEIIVIDSASPENEGAIVKEFQQRSPHIRYIRTSARESIYKVWNRGIKAAQGKYITNANTDDRHREDALEVMARELDTHPEIALVYGDVFVTGLPNQTFAGHVRCGYHLRPDYAPEIMLSGCHMGPQPMWRRDIHETIGWFDDQLSSAGDYEFWCRIALRFPMRHIPEFLGLYFENPAGICNSAMDVSQRETEEVFRRYAGKLPPPPCSFTTNLQYRGTVTETGYVNIGMITYNRLEFTRQAIDALVLRTDFPYVLTVVDNASTDGTREYLQEQKRKGIIKNLVLLEENVGVAKASNLAWSLEPEADYYLKLDNDIVIQKHGWLGDMVRIIDDEQSFGALAYSFEPTSYPLVSVNGHSIRFKNGNLGGACFLIPVRTRDKIGFWCEDYGLYSEEDYDYCFRLSLVGLHYAYMADEEVGFHLPAGKAAKIDENSLIATDGVEETSQQTYRLWKDEIRRQTISSGLRDRNLLGYKNGTKSICIASHYTTAWINAGRPGLVQPSFQSVSSHPMKVAVFSHDGSHHACGYYRVYSPAKALGESVSFAWPVKTENGSFKVDLSDLHECDLFIIQRFFPHEVSMPFIEQLMGMGRPVIFELDDLITGIPADNSTHDWAQQCLPHIEDVLKKCAAITASTEELGIKLSCYNEHVYVLPNLIDLTLWRKQAPRSCGPVVIGYAGTMTHASDFALLEPVLERLSAKYGNNVAFTFMGCATERLSKLAGFQFIPFELSFEAYAKKLQDTPFDIMLSPLEDNVFNRCKSNIKWLEYSSCGIAGVYADLPPYNSSVKHGETGLLAGRDPEQWFQAICLLIDQPALRRKIAEQSRNEVLTNYTLEKNARLWLEAYQEIMEKFHNKSQVPASMAVPQQQSCNVQVVSIVIPVFNQLHFTQQCLQALFSTLPSDITSEIIVVDNASSDGTDAYLRGLGDRVRVISHVTNLGFAKACNQGARAARGNFLLFLNNDTVVQPGWLEPLLAAMQSGEADICGARLLCPDGRCQHAGIAFDERGLGYHIFGGFPGDAPEVTQRREMQAVTGACLMISKQLFTELEGFDEEFRNGFEDVDLCLRAGEYGKKILYLPESVVVHYAEQTPGRKDHDVPNMQRFFRRWSGKLRQDDQQLYRQFGLTCSKDQEGRFRIARDAGSVPQVSIIIPLFNQEPLTEACLSALQRFTPQGCYELVLVDNASTDGTPKLLERWRHAATVIRNLENAGFARACNQGARAARGEYLLFLNNDTEVTDGWLEPLLEVLEQDAAVAATGSKLLYPDGTIQHAGVLLVDDRQQGDQLVARHLYQRMPGDYPAANVLRSMQALTAACLLVRRTAFEAAGGFDEGYWNGYEDVDLCLKLAAAGQRIVYQPASVVLHHESQSGPERFSQAGANIQHLHQRWLGKVQADAIIQADGTIQHGPGMLNGTTAIYQPPAASASARAAQQDSSARPRQYQLVPLVAGSASSLLQRLSSSHKAREVLQRYTVAV